MNISREILDPGENKARISWVLFIFLFVGFVFVTPWDFSMSVTEEYITPSLDSYGTVDLVKKGVLAHQVALISMGVFGFISLIGWRRYRFRINGLLGLVVLFFIIWTAASIVWSINPWLTAKTLLRLIILYLGALAVAQRLSLRETVFLTAFVCGLTLMAGVIVELSLGTFNPFSLSWRLSGVMHPVSQGWNAGLLVIASFALLKSSNKGSAIYIGVVLLGLFFLFLTKSRMAFFATCLGVGVIWSFASTKAQKIAVLFCSIILGCVLGIIYGSDIISYGEKAISFGRGEEGKASIATLTGRIPVWNEILDYVSKRPILGYGYNSFLDEHILIDISKSAGWVPSQPHSGYIGTLLELGIIGLSALVLMQLLALKMSIDLSKRNFDYAFVAAVLVWLSSNLITESYLMTSSYFQTFLGMILLAKLSFLKLPSINGVNELIRERGKAVPASRNRRRWAIEHR